MTAEIAVMNREAIALAADSAVTMRGEKVFFSANKIFALSRHEPVAAMIYGNYGLMGIPWEPVLKSFRSDLGRTKLKTISAYARALIRFISKHKGFYSPALCDNACRGHLAEIFRFLRREMIDHKQARTGTKAEKPDAEDVNDVIDYFYNFWKKATLLTGITGKKITRLIKKYGKFIFAVIGDLFKDIAISDEHRNRLFEIGVQCLVKCPRGFSWPSLTGLVVAGFGDKELFPALSHCSLHGIFDGTLHYRIDVDDRIGDSGDALVFPFAQTQMIYAFMEGVDPSYQQVIQDETATLVDDYPAAVVNRCKFLSKDVKQKIIAEFAKVQPRIKRDFLAGLQQYRKQTFVDETIGLIAMVPKSELAILAESLVNLTSLRRKISLDSETVGGPVDVALISKSEGLIWIKRKHYFDPALNRQYLYNAYDSKE